MEVDIALCFGPDDSFRTFYIGEAVDAFQHGCVEECSWHPSGMPQQVLKGVSDSRVSTMHCKNLNPNDTTYSTVLYSVPAEERKKRSTKIQTIVSLTAHC